MAEYIKAGNKEKKFKLRKPDYSYSKREVVLILVLTLLILIAGAYAYWVEKKENDKVRAINTFEACVAAGNPVMESYPERCVAGDKFFVKQY